MRFFWFSRKAGLRLEAGCYKKLVCQSCVKLKHSSVEKWKSLFHNLWKRFKKDHLHNQKVNILCAITLKDIVGPIFFKETINSVKYRAQIIKSFITRLAEHQILYDSNKDRSNKTIHLPTVMVHYYTFLVYLCIKHVQTHLDICQNNLHYPFILTYIIW